MIGEKVFVSANTDIVCNTKIEIGEESNISWHCLIMDTDFHQIYEVDGENVINSPSPITVENHVWIGCNSIILKGVRIASHTIIAAGSIVSDKLEESYCIYADTRCLRRGVNWSD